jgi:hypothetical protein
MNLPPFVKALAFWKGIAFLVAGAVALLAYFGVIEAGDAYTYEAILAFILTVLQFFGVTPEIRARGLK